MTTLLEQATKTVSEAIVLDRQRRYRMAFDKYHHALSHFLLLLKHEKCNNSKRELSKRINEYLTRTENIKDMLDDRKNSHDSRTPEGVNTDTSKNEEIELSEKILQTKVNDGSSTITMSDIAGLENVKQLLEECIKLPLLFPSLFTGNRKPWKGILLYGPGGTGKSMIASAVANETKAAFYSISSSDIVSKYQGESEKLVRQLFKTARDSAPSVIFIDEVDSMCTTRQEGENDASRRIKTEFLVQLQGVGKDNDGILVIGATNTPWDLDSAIRRRFEKRIYVPLPDKMARKQMFKIHSGEYGNEIDFNYMASETEGFSGSDINALVNDALFEPIRKCQRANQFSLLNGKYTPVINDEPYLGTLHDITLDNIEPEQLNVPPVTEYDFNVALSRASKSMSSVDLNKYNDWTNQFGT
jgi:vacuolar protein-sorting-associated protein 4